MKQTRLDLQKAIEDLHNCSASFQKSVPVKDEFEGRTAWEGIVHIFELTDHPEADKCYFWSSRNEDSEERKSYAVLHIPPVDSPEKAVRASIIQNFRTEK